MSLAREAVPTLPTANQRAMRIAVSHPHGNANSYHAALAFSESGWLDHFETGLLRGARSSKLMRLSPDIERRARNRNYEEIPLSRKRAHRLVETVSRIGRKVKPGGLTSRVNWYDFLFWGHDFQISNSLDDRLDAVYAYEDGARLTFEAARKAGITLVYELPLGYYRSVAAEINRARRDWPELQPDVYAEPLWKQTRKDAELALADVIVVASDWARESLTLADAAAGKPVVAVPYGTPVEEILPRSQPPDGPFTVLFAGQIGLRKGVPHLIKAWEELKLRDARLWMAGSVNLPSDYLRKHCKTFQHLGALPRTELLEVMKQVDLFVFPSLAEGFGLVIGEAMAAGVPVLTTTNTGGPALITEGVEGWCVSAHEVAPLTERLEWASKHRDELYRMGQRARQKAEEWTWADYRRKLIAELSPYLRDRQSTCS